MSWAPTGKRGAPPDTALEHWLARQVIKGLDEHGWTRAELARRVGYDRTAVSGVLSLRKRGSMMLWTCMLEAVGARLN